MPILKVWDEETQKYIGIAAIKGDKGENGEKGDIGPQGPQGEPGPAGEPGVYTKVNGIAPDETGNVTLTATDVSAMPTTGGDMTGPINMGTNRITDLGTPAANTDAATKGYADLAAYPVGAIYISTNSTSPASLFGGTWTQLKDRFLLGAGDTYSAGSTGGEAKHTLTIDEMPYHSHNTYADDNFCAYNTGNNNDWKQALVNAYSGPTISDKWIGFTGGGAAHNNMPPYLAVYMWQRVA